MKHTCIPLSKVLYVDKKAMDERPPTRIKLSYVNQQKDDINIQFRFTYLLEKDEGVECDIVSGEVCTNSSWCVNHGDHIMGQGDFCGARLRKCEVLITLMCKMVRCTITVNRYVHPNISVAYHWFESTGLLQYASNTYLILVGTRLDDKVIVEEKLGMAINVTDSHITPA